RHVISLYSLFFSTPLAPPPDFYTLSLHDALPILLAKDLLRLYIAEVRERFDIREYMRPAIFVPESKRLNVLLREFRRNRNHMAIDRKSTRLNSSHVAISYAVFCLKKKKTER